MANRFFPSGIKWGPGLIYGSLCFWVLLSAFILEAVSSKGILDDNLLMPLGSALVMTFLCRMQGTEVDFYPIQKLIYPILD